MPSPLVLPAPADTSHILSGSETQEHFSAGKWPWKARMPHAGPPVLPAPADTSHILSGSETQEQFLIAMDGVNAENAGAIFGRRLGLDRLAAATRVLQANHCPRTYNSAFAGVCHVPVHLEGSPAGQ